jgi:hypothetical protein
LSQIVQPVELPAGWSDPEAAMPVTRSGGGMSEGKAKKISARPLQRSAPRPAASPPKAARPLPPPAPPAPMRSSFAGLPQSEAKEEEAARPGATAYLESLRELAHELQTVARGAADATALRLLRQRLEEWVEDLRSVGGSETLAIAVTALVRRLSAALATADRVGEALAVAGELAKLAATPPEPARRVAFWK